MSPDAEPTGPVRFTAPLQAEPGGGRFVVVPFDVPATFGTHRPAVVATINGHTFRARIVPYRGRSMIGLNKAVREAAGIVDGAQLTVDLVPDTAPREIVPPPELAATLGRNPSAKAIFDRLSYTHRREYAQWVAEAKKPETRARRASQAIDRLLAGHREPTG